MKEEKCKKKKYKLKKKNVKMLLIFLAILLVVMLYHPMTSILKLMGKDYHFQDALTIYQSGIIEEVLEKDYSETIANIAGDKDYQKENFEIYHQLEYYDGEDFLKNVNALIKLKYQVEEINQINQKQDSKMMDYVTKNYVPKIGKWLAYDFVKGENFKRYLKNFNGNYKETIVKVNIGLDQPYYENAKIVTEYSTDVLANKYNQLDKSFVPKELTPLDHCSSSGHYLAGDAKKAYDELCEKITADGLSLSVNSSYRSYEDQEKIYQFYLNLYGQSYVDKYVAIPGYSEHQTGLALDVKSENSNIFKNSKEYQWMIENAYQYGFILRYPENKKDITGYSSEAWHFRYVGKEIAKYIKENNLTYEEYYVMFLDK